MATIAGRVVVVVEDDDSMRQALGRLLEVAGFRAVTFGSAEALLSTGGVDGAVCVVSDFKLPAMSGLELMIELNARAPSGSRTHRSDSRMKRRRAALVPARQTANA